MMWLVKNGVPWHVALGLGADEEFTLTESERTAIGIIFGNFEGGSFDFEAWEWKKGR